MARKTLNTILSDLRTDLSDIPEAEWSAIELERAVERAIADLSRFLPRELIFDLTLTSTIIENYFTIDLGDYINEEDGMEELIRVQRVEYPANHSPQKFCQFDIFANLLSITGMGEVSGQETLSADNVLRIYYDSPHAMPEDEDAGTCPAFLDNTVLLASAAYALFQRALNFLHEADTDFISARTALTSAATALDKVATYLENNSNEDSKYWLTKMTTDIADLRTAMITAQDAANAKIDAGDTSGMDTHIASAATALAKVTTYLENNSNEDAKGWLTKITTDLASLRTAVNTAADAANTYLDAVADDLTAADAANGYLADYVAGTSAPASKKYLDDGDAYLNKIADGGEGQEVPLAYRQYAEAVKSTITTPYERARELLAQNATFRTNAAMIFAQETAQRLSNLRSYIEQAESWGRIANGFVSEAMARVSLATQIASREEVQNAYATNYLSEATSRLGNLHSYIEQATAWGNIAAGFVREAEQRLTDSVQYNNIATSRIALADKFKEQANERRNEAWMIWRDRTSYIGDFSTSSIRQMPGY